MFSDLLTWLPFSYDKLPNEKLIAIRDFDAADGSFLFCHFISMYMKCPKGKILLISFNHSAEHFHTVLAKIGINLNRLIDERRLILIDWGKLLTNWLENTEDVPFEVIDQQSDLSSIFSLLYCDKAKNNRDKLRDSAATQKLLNWMISLLNNLSKSDDESSAFASSAVFIDSLNVLLDFGLCYADVCAFLIRLKNSVCVKDGTLIVGIHDSKLFSSSADSENSLISDDHKRLNLHVCHLADLLLEVSLLKTGISKDIQGEVSFAYCTFCAFIK